MVWPEYLTSLAVTPEGEQRLIPAGPPDDPAILTAAEGILEVQLPADLLALYGEMDGVDDPSVYWRLVMRTSELATTNIDMRSWKGSRNATNFHDFVFFAGRGNGDLFGFRVTDGIAQPDQIVDWDHALDEFTHIADSLADFFQWWVR